MLVSKSRLIGKLDDLRGRSYDFIHNVETFSFVSRSSVKTESENRELGSAYERTPFRAVKRLLENLVWSDGTAFIDFGCGKGLTLLAAAKYPFSTIIGVEYSSELATIAEKNVMKYRGMLPSRDRVSVIYGDATEFAFPAIPTVCYFFNPFEPVVMERVLDNLAASLQKCPREIQLVFYGEYSRGLVLSKFHIASFEAIPYFHLYRVASAKEARGESAEITSWKMIRIAPQSGCWHHD